MRWIGSGDERGLILLVYTTKQPKKAWTQSKKPVKISHLSWLWLSKKVYPVTALQGRLLKIRVMSSGISSEIKLPIFVILNQKSKYHVLSAKKTKWALVLVVRWGHAAHHGQTDNVQLVLGPSLQKRMMVDNVTKLNAIKISLYVKLWFSVYWVDYGHIWFDITYAGALWEKKLCILKRSPHQSQKSSTFE